LNESGFWAGKRFNVKTSTNSQNVTPTNPHAYEHINQGKATITRWWCD